MLDAMEESRISEYAKIASAKFKLLRSDDGISHQIQDKILKIFQDLKINELRHWQFGQTECHKICM